MGSTDGDMAVLRFWYWVIKISKLLRHKIRWDPSFSDDDGPIFIASVDGTDFKTWEKKHPLLNQDRRACTRKHNHGGVKCEIAISINESKVVWVSGPHRGGKHDITTFREGLKQMMPPGKLIIADSGCIGESG